MSKKAQVHIGEIELTETELIVTKRSPQETMGEGLKAVTAFVSKVNVGFQAPTGATRTIPLEQVDSLELNWFTEANSLTTGMLRLAGSKANLPVGNLKIVTSSGGPNGTVTLGVEQQQKEAIIAFVEEIKLASKTRRSQFAGDNGEATKVCPDCAEDVKEAARKCRFCGFIFE